MKSEVGSTLKRYFGGWSSRYRRFTVNLSSPTIRVKTLRPGEGAREGIPCILHWVKRVDLVGLGMGSVCQADGWPVEFWKIFLSVTDRLPEGTVA